MFDSSSYSTKTKYYDYSSKWFVRKIKDETGVVEVEEFVRLKLKMYLFLVEDNSKHKKAKVVNINVVPTISYSENKKIIIE